MIHGDGASIFRITRSHLLLGDEVVYELLRYAPVIKLVAELREDLRAANIEARAGEVATEGGGGVGEDEGGREGDGGGAQVGGLEKGQLGGGGVKADHEVGIGRVKRG